MPHLNIECKARTTNLSQQEKILLQQQPRFVGEDIQTDTYFFTKQGRLKIREGNIENALIYYEREDIAGSKASKVLLYTYEPNPLLREILTITNGIKVVVKKTRRIYFIENVKFHFDTIEGLGEFVEVEAIDTSDVPDEKKLQQQCDHYAQLLGIKEDEYMQQSYSDMLMKS